MQPTPTNSPASKLVTLLPMSDTRPIISCPGTRGTATCPSRYAPYGYHYGRRHKRMSILMSLSPTDLRSNSKGFNSSVSLKAA